VQLQLQILLLLLVLLWTWSWHLLLPLLLPAVQVWLPAPSCHPAAALASQVVPQGALPG
jgi:hypothetical protein